MLLIIVIVTPGELLCSGWSTGLEHNPRGYVQWRGFPGLPLMLQTTGSDLLLSRHLGREEGRLGFGTTSVSIPPGLLSLYSAEPLPHGPRRNQRTQLHGLDSSSAWHREHLRKEQRARNCRNCFLALGSRAGAPCPEKTQETCAFLHSRQSRGPERRRLSSVLLQEVS